MMLPLHKALRWKRGGIAVKHGVKVMGMAAWGRTHSDVLIWNMVAFLQKLPSLSPEQYRTLVKSAPEDHDEIMKSQDHAH